MARRTVVPLKLDREPRFKGLGSKDMVQRNGAERMGPKASSALFGKPVKYTGRMASAKPLSMTRMLPGALRRTRARRGWQSTACLPE